MNAVITTLIIATGTMALLSMLIYITFGRPWEEFFGRAVMALECGIFAVMAYASQRRLIYPSPIPRNQFAPAVFAYGVIMLVCASFSAALWRKLVTSRGGIRMALRIRRDRRDRLAEGESLGTLVTALDLLDDEDFALVMTSMRPRRGLGDRNALAE